MSRPFPPRGSSSSTPFTRVNGKIRAREVRVLGPDGQQLGILTLNDALAKARQMGVDLVEIAPTAQPPVCKLVDFGKYRYELAKRDKESKKHQHANKVKEVQLSANIDPHDFGVKFSHAVDFLCEDMKVKISLRFRGREMAHTEIGFQVVNRFINDSAPWAHPDAPPKLLGKSINVMLSPLPRNKRAKNPHVVEGGADSAPQVIASAAPSNDSPQVNHVASAAPGSAAASAKSAPAPAKPAGFANNPFTGLDLGKLPKDDASGAQAA